MTRTAISSCRLIVACIAKTTLSSRPCQLRVWRRSFWRRVGFPRVRSAWERRIRGDWWWIGCRDWTGVWMISADRPLVGWLSQMEVWMRKYARLCSVWRSRVIGEQLAPVMVSEIGIIAVLIKFNWVYGCWTPQISISHTLLMIKKQKKFKVLILSLWRDKFLDWIFYK